MLVITYHYHHTLLQSSLLSMLRLLCFGFGRTYLLVNILRPLNQL